MGNPGAAKLTAFGAAGLLGLALAWQITASGMAAYLQDSDPQAALRWRGDNGRALAAVSEAAVARGETEEAKEHARRALAAAPLETTAFRTLAQALAREGQSAPANQLMAHAGRLTLRDPAVSFWLYRGFLAQRDYPRAFFHADAAMRRAPRTAELLVPDLIGAISDPAAAPPLAEKLGRNPYWRRVFMRELGRSPNASMAAVGLLQALAQTPSPPTNDEVSPVLARMARVGDRRQAYRAWISFLPPADRPSDLRGVFDGTFRRPPGPRPFGWQLRRSEAAEASLDPATQGSGLQVRYDGFSDVEVARQTLLLPSGRYRLSSSGELLEGAGGRLEWRVECPGFPGPLARTSLRIGDGFDGATQQEFDMPPGCPSQYLILSTLGSDRRSSALLLIDKVEIAPMGSAP